MSQAHHVSEGGRGGEKDKKWPKESGIEGQRHEGIKQRSREGDGWDIFGTVQRAGHHCSGLG